METNNIISVPSPNHYAGRNGYLPIAIVIHIMEGTLSGTDSWFRSTVSKVSAHYGIGKNGEIHQYVDEKDAAWHAGRVNAPGWALIKPAGAGKYINPNLYTIGIEHEGNDDTEWTDQMYQASSGMIKQISVRWGIPLDRDHVIGHHEIYSLKTCPGFRVDLNKLIAMASGTRPDVNQNPELLKILQVGTATTTTRLNIRRSPDRNIIPVDTIAAGVQLSYDGFTNQGEKIEGNSRWYYTSDGNWFWSGGVKNII